MTVWGPQPPEPGEEAARAEIPPGHLSVVAWVDPLVEANGVDPRSLYVERCWLGVLGPSATWLVRLLADGLERHPQGYRLHLETAARSLGLSGRAGPGSPFARTLGRCRRFGMVRLHADILEMRRLIGPVPERLLTRLPSEVQEVHRRWQQAQEEARGPGSRSSSRSVRTPKPVPPLVR